MVYMVLETKKWIYLVLAEIYINIYINKIRLSLTNLIVSLPPPSIYCISQCVDSLKTLELNLQSYYIYLFQCYQLLGIVAVSFLPP